MPANSGRSCCDSFCDSTKHKQVFRLTTPYYRPLNETSLPSAACSGTRDTKYNMFQEQGKFAMQNMKQSDAGRALNIVNKESWTNRASVHAKKAASTEDGIARPRSSA